MPEKKRIVIAEDYKMFREGLKAMLTAINNYDVVGEAGDGFEAIKSVSRLKPDLLLLDISMPRLNGISVIADLKKRCPEVKILALTIHDDEQYVLQTFKAGADGYCLKDATQNELLIAVASVLEGKNYVSPGITGDVLKGYLAGRRHSKSERGWDTVTLREREILKLLAEGYENIQIASFLNISVKTVEKHRSNIMEKLDLHTIADLTRYAIEKGLADARR
jgi:DNA-binding NarL/FixJ family response regulator